MGIHAWRNRALPKIGGNAWAICLSICLLTPPVAGSFAQGPSGGLTGLVRDPEGTVIVNAEAAAKHLATGQVFEAATDRTGTWQLSLLPLGDYEVSFEVSR